MSRTIKVKSLRDCILKSSVVNFDRIFFGNGGVLKNHICLPPRLFENIQNKSNEIFWIIPPKSLTACLSNRDALNWVNIDLRMVTLTLDDLLQMEKSDFPIKRFSFGTNHLTDAMLDVIEKFSSTIEVLEIDYHHIRHYVHILEKRHNQSMIKFPKLKVLCINFDAVPFGLFKRFDFTSCSDSLKKLCLFGDRNLPNLTFVEKQLFMNFIDSLKVLQNLESLTVQDVDFSEKINIVHLKNLRTLSLAAIPSNIPPGQRLVNILPKLENLTLPRDNLIDELNSLNRKKLNYVGDNFGEDIPEHLKQVAKNIGSCTDFQSCLKYMDYSCSFYEYAIKTFNLLLMLSQKRYLSEDKSLLFTGCDIMKIEKAILAQIMWGNYKLEYYVCSIAVFVDNWSHDFIGKVTNLVTSLQISKDERINDRLEFYKIFIWSLLKDQPFQDFKKGYIALNPNSSISQLYNIDMGA